MESRNINSMLETKPKLVAIEGTKLSTICGGLGRLTMGQGHRGSREKTALKGGHGRMEASG